MRGELPRPADEFGTLARPACSQTFLQPLPFDRSIDVMATMATGMQSTKLMIFDSRAGMPNGPAGIAPNRNGGHTGDVGGWRRWIGYVSMCNTFKGGVH